MAAGGLRAAVQQPAVRQLRGQLREGPGAQGLHALQVGVARYMLHSRWCGCWHVCLALAQVHAWAAED